MSRIGKLPIDMPKGVTVTMNGQELTVKGPKGELKQTINPAITVEVKDGQVHVSRPNDEKENRAMHGLYRALIHNMIVGVSEGFKTEQELVGVGYRVEAQGQLLKFSLGYSHDIYVQLPDEVKAEVPQVKKGANPILILKCADKQLLGMVAAKIRSFRKPEPYKGKGIKFVGEVLRRKAGKTAAAK